MAKPQSSMRLSTLTRRQIEALQQACGLNQTEVIAMAIDRMYREERATMEQEHTIYRVAEAPEFWGPDCRPEWGRELAEAMAQALRQYAETNGLAVEIETVYDTTPHNAQSTGDENVIASLDAERERLFNTSPWEWAKGTSAYDEWK